MGNPKFSLNQTYKNKMKNIVTILAIAIVIGIAGSANAQRVLMGPRLSGNFNIYNQKGLTGTWNGLGVGVGGQIDVLFNKTVGILGNLTVFDMKNFSNTQTTNNVTTDQAYSLSYATIDVMFQANFSNYYFAAGPTLGVKLNSSGEITQTATGQAPVVQASNIETKSTVFNITAETGYNIPLSPDMYLGTSLGVNIPLSSTYNTPGIDNSILSLKLGVALKFRI